MSKYECEAVTLEYKRGIDFEFHIEGQEIVVDRCEGITVADGMSLFPGWILDAMTEAK